VRFVPQRTLGCLLGLWSFVIREIPCTAARLQIVIGGPDRLVRRERDLDGATQTRKPIWLFLVFGLFLLRAETNTPPRPEPQPPPRSPRRLSVSTSVSSGAFALFRHHSQTTAPSLELAVLALSNPLPCDAPYLEMRCFFSSFPSARRSFAARRAARLTLPPARSMSCIK